MLAGWCDDQLKEAAETFKGAERTEVALLAPAIQITEHVDGLFDEFIEALHLERAIVVSEVHKGQVAKAWRECAADAARILALRCLWDTDSDVMARFSMQQPAVDAARGLAMDGEESFDKWNFDLAWHLAETILSVAMDAPSSSDDDGDEPVEESESEEESEGESEGESEESGSGSGSESGSEQEF